MSERDLQVLLVGRNEERVSILEQGLRQAGCSDIVLMRDTHNLLRRIVEADPDVIFVELGNPEPRELEQMLQISGSVRRPIALFVDESDDATIAAAVDAGIGAYIVDGLRKERVSAILALAVSRFHAFNRLREEVERARRELEERKLVERAKGILMKDRALTEEQAYDLLRRTAMNENRRLADIAQSLILTAGLLR